MRYFETIFMEQAAEFISTLCPKTVNKILYNIDLAEHTNDPRLFKKLTKEIWEFRTHYDGIQVRLLAFWDKNDKTQTLVIATHGFVKKGDKVPQNEITRAIQLRDEYFQSKLNR